MTVLMDFDANTRGAHVRHCDDTIPDLGSLVLRLARRHRPEVAVLEMLATRRWDIQMGAPKGVGCIRKFATTVCAVTSWDGYDYALTVNFVDGGE